MQSFGAECARKFELKMYNSNEDSEKGTRMFFLETSGRSWITPREACCLESASRMSNLQVTVLLISSFLDLNENSSCYLFQQYPNIHFYTIDLQDAFQHTPLEKIIERKEFKTSQHKAIHLSDMLRLAIIYKNGGFYSDLDTVTIKDLSQFHNIIGQTNMKDTTLDYLSKLEHFSTIIGVDNLKNMSAKHLQNAEFKFEKNHKLLWKTMEEIAKRYEGRHRIEIGPLFITSVVKSFYNVTDIEHFKNQELEIVPNDYFYPAKAYEISKLWTIDTQNEDDWKRLLKDSYIIHFYSSQTNSLVVQRNVNYEVYSYLGPKYCPVAYWSSESF